MRLRWVGYILVGLVTAVAASYAAFSFSPWPSVLLIRYAFHRDAVEKNRALEKHVPANVGELRDERYGDNREERFDVFFPAQAPSRALPAIVWVHGGGFVAGDKTDVSNYMKILAGRGYVTVSVGYSVAPGARYPTPVLQAGKALAFLSRNAGRYRIDPNRLFLAGDSAGSQIAAQLAATVGNPAYAAIVGVNPAIERTQLRGIALFCGVYDAAMVTPEGPFADFIRTVIWSYLGTKRLGDDPRVAEFSVNRHLTPQFPPAFVSVGNADPLAPQSALMAEAIRAQGVDVDTLFFPNDYSPALPHEYQFDLDSSAGEKALERLTAFLDRLASQPTLP
ncbi:alpha/beta hydrolase [Mesorhizobium sp.]|uniref:alpha/beta hydrolase n=1 Tax=Mesorhizobium sp. TaxID=1871066 RepID=UPI001201EEED|nr:alpha/beta hydrolase [Mesorhizobium sp.]TIO06875.1 MAG: alpha/beta hydrolase [Mesorhizobium sp.]TIO34944.1 MAG: alpha/beta hydrolase [Mesorhizobium sp.]TIP12158.1 MAG: alpha/beta hydrolase [Mesorhizobium sp.]